MQFTRKARRHGGSLKIVIPPELIELYKIKESDLITAEIIKVNKK